MGETCDGLGGDLDDRAARNAVEHDGQFGSIGHGLEVLVETFLGGLVVVGANLKAAASTSATDAASGVNKITKWFEPKEKECPESEDDVKPKEQVEAQKKIQEGDASLYLSLFEYCENENMKEEACP